MAPVNPADERRALLARMVSEQPGRLARKMRAAGHPGADADDLAQETLTRALRSLADVRGPADEALLCGWVDRIATNLSSNTRRSLARHPHENPLPEAEDPPGPGLTVQDDADLIACRSTLEVLLAGLPDEQRVVFVARVLEERTSAQVAADLGIPEDSVRWRLRTARRRLREQIDVAAH